MGQIDYFKRCRRAHRRDRFLTDAERKILAIRTARRQMPGNLRRAGDYFRAHPELCGGAA